MDGEGTFHVAQQTLRCLLEDRYQLDQGFAAPGDDRGSWVSATVPVSFRHLLLNPAAVMFMGLVRDYKNWS